MADTATAAVLGALAAPEVAKRSQRQGVTVVNVGNSHVAAFLVFKGRILGVYEHHTGMLDTDALLFDLKEFGFGWLPTNKCAPKAGTAARFSRLCLLKRKALPRPSRSGRAARCCWGTPNSSPRTAT